MLTEPLDTREAAQAYLDRVFRPGTEWMMVRFEYGWVITPIPVTEAQIRRAREPGRSTWVLEASTGRITGHGPFPPRVIIQRYLTAIAEGRDPGGSPIYPKPPPEDPKPNAERLAPTPSDGSVSIYYFLNHYQGWEKPASGVTVLASGPLGHRSMTLWLPEKTWRPDSIAYLAQDRYLEILRSVERSEMEEFLQTRMAVTLPSEAEFVDLYRQSGTTG